MRHAFEGKGCLPIVLLSILLSACSAQPTPTASTAMPTASVALASPTPPATVTTTATAYKSSLWFPSLSPDGHWIAVGDDQGFALYDANTFDKIWSTTFEKPAYPKGWMPDSSAVVVWIGSNYLTLDASNGRVLSRLPSREDEVFAGLSRDGKTSFYVSSCFYPSPKYLILRDSRTSALIRKIDLSVIVEQACPEIAVWSGDFSKLAISADGQAAVLTASSGNITGLLPPGLSEEPYAPITILAWSPDDRTVAVHYLDHKVVFWNGNTVSKHESTKVAGEIMGISWSPDQALLLLKVYPDKMLVLDGRTYERLKLVTGPGFILGWSQDSKVLYTYAYLNETAETIGITAYDPRDFTIIRHLSNPQP